MEIIYTESEYGMEVIQLPAFSISAMLRDRGYEDLEPNTIEKEANIKIVINQDVKDITFIDFEHKSGFKQTYIGPTKNFIKDGNWN